jgi:Cu/Ag efflux protein CusF
MRNIIVALFVAALALPAFAGTETKDATGAAVSQTTTMTRNAPSETPGGMVTRTTKISGHVTAIDTANRTVTIKGAGGNDRVVKCSPAVKNFDQIQVGNKVNVEYTESLALSLRKATEAPSAEETAALESAKKGEMPGMDAARTVSVTANVEKINYKTREVTLKGPEGNKVTFTASDEVKRLKEIKKGDQVVALYSEALALDVTLGTAKAKK